MIELEKYLFERELTEDKFKGKLDSLEELQKVATLWNNNKDTIKLMVLKKIEVIKNRIVYDAVPQETIVLRQSIVELAGLLDDFESCTSQIENINNNKQQ